MEGSGWVAMAFDPTKIGQPVDGDPTKVYGPNGTPIAKSDWDQSQSLGKNSQTSGANSAYKTESDPYKWTPSANYNGASSDNRIQYDPASVYSPNQDGHYATNAINIDPTSGRMQYNTGGYGGSSGATNIQNGQYSGTQDYGLGPNGLGVIPMATDANGNPTAFYAGTGYGAGQVYHSLTEAQQGAKDYAAWYSSQHPAAAATTSSAPVAAQPAGELTKPGAGENYYDSTKGFYTGGNNAQKAYDVTANQPTQEEQYWNKYSGIFQNPNYLDQVYDTAQAKSQTTLDRKASSGGWGDSGAAARATADMGATYQNQKLQAMQGFATTGGTLAGAADASRNQRVSSAQGVDSGNTSQIAAGQTAANSAETQQQNRLNGGISSATTLGNDQATLMAAGLDKATSEQLATNVQAIAMQVQGGNLTAQQGYNQASEMMAGLGTMDKAAMSAYLLGKFPGAKSSSTDPYSVSTTPGSGASLTATASGYPTGT